MHMADFLQNQSPQIVNTKALFLALLFHDVRRANDTQSDKTHGHLASNFLAQERFSPHSWMGQIKENDWYSFCLARLICSVHSCSLNQLNPPLNTNPELILHKLADGIERIRDPHNPLDIERILLNAKPWEKYGFTWDFFKRLIHLDQEWIQRLDNTGVKHGTWQEIEHTLTIGRSIGLLT